MNYQDFLIEVKTKWTKCTDGYEREIIQYNCIPGEVIDKPIFACRYLNAINHKTEKKDHIDSNEMIIHAIYTKNHEEIKTPTELIKCLLDYTEYQWKYEG